MKKNYIYLLILLVATVFVTLLLSNLYKKEVNGISYSYDKLNKIIATEFEEYIIEHPDTIIYIADKTNLDNNKFEKKFVNKLEKLGLIENAIYIEKKEINSDLEKKLKENYSYKYSEEKLPVIIVINDGKLIQTSVVDKSSIADTIIDYGVFE